MHSLKALRVDSFVVFDVGSKIIGHFPGGCHFRCYC